MTVTVTATAATAKTPSTRRYGFVGLGNMGAPMAANLAKRCPDLGVYDADPQAAKRAEFGQAAASLDELAAAADTLFLSVPDGRVSAAIAEQLIALPAAQRATRAVIDLSTTGIDASKAVAAKLAEADIAYADAPVSGGVSGARAASLALIWGGSGELLEKHRPALAAIAKNIFHVGDAAGQGQAVKLLNNFLSATALAATSEAMLFSASQGLDMATVLDVVNASTGRNTASSDKFPQRILTNSFDAGFHTALMRKDVTLYAECVAQAGTPRDLGSAVAQLWQNADAALPGSDITEFFCWLRDRNICPAPPPGQRPPQ